MRARAVMVLALVVVVVVVVGAALVGVADSDRRPTPTKLRTTAPPFEPLLGIVSGRRQQQLVRVDRDTLRPRPGRRIGLGSEGCVPRAGGSVCTFVPPWSVSPDRSLLALARHQVGVLRSLRLVRVGQMRVVADVPLGGGAIGLLAWPAPSRVLAVQELCCDQRQQLVAVDVAGRRAAGATALGGTVVRAESTARDLVLLLAPAKQIGPSRLAIVDSRGSVRFVELERIPAGEKLVDRTTYRTQRQLPGLAVDPKGRRAFVVAPEAVAEVDLASGAVSYHRLTRDRSLLSRLRDWIDPIAHAKVATGRIRSARWLGSGLIAVTGADEDRTEIRPAGLSLVDTRNWSRRTIDRGATDVRVVGDLLLATGSSSQSSTGLTAYSFDGDKRFQLLDGREAWLEQIYDGRVYLRSSRPGGRLGPLHVVDLASGRITARRAQRIPSLVADAESGWWDD